jgi:hypothetical protein
MYKSILPILLALLLAPCAVRGDGLVVYHVEVGEAETVPVRAETQRAVLWHRVGTWELTLQPVFPRATGEAAWIVPFPVVPEVEERDAAFLDELEALTAPIFVPHCVEPEGGGWFGCGAAAMDGEGLSRSGTAVQDVTVWDAGVTSELEYVILEANSPGALVTWLDENDFLVPAALRDQLERVSDQVIFAAKLLDDLDPGAPLSPLSFRLPGLAFEAAIYPLRLTAFVAPDDGMELALWIVAEDQVLLPKSIPWLPYMGGHQVSKPQWEENMVRIQQAFPPSGGLIMAYSGILERNPLYTGAEVAPAGPGVAVTAESLGLVLPERWDEGIVEIADSGARVSRFHAVLTAEGMAQDLTFEAASLDDLPEVDNFFWEQVPCDELEGGSEGTVQQADSGGRDPMHSKAAGAALIPLCLLAGVLALRRSS